MEQQTDKTRKLPCRFKLISILDTIRIILLVLFTAIFAHYVWTVWMFFPSNLRDYFPTIGFTLRDVVVFALLAIPSVAVILLLVKSLDHLKKSWLIQVILYGCWAILVFALLMRTESGSFAMAFVLSYVFAACILFVVQLLVLNIREIIRKKIANRTRERILGYGLLGTSVLALLLVFVILPTYSDLGREVNEILQNPDEYRVSYYYDRFREKQLVLTEEELEELISSVQVNTDYDVNQEIDKEESTFDPDVIIVLQDETRDDTEIRLTWNSDTNRIGVYVRYGTVYSGSQYYADGSTFASIITQIPSYVEKE